MQCVCLDISSLNHPIKVNILCISYSETGDTRQPACMFYVLLQCPFMTSRDKARVMSGFRICILYQLDCYQICLIAVVLENLILTLHITMAIVLKIF